MKFKRFFTLILALLLLASSAGMSLSMHFCGGIIAYVKPVFSNAGPSMLWPDNLFQEKSKSCCTWQDQDEGGCCKNKIVSLDADDEVISTNLTFDFESKLFFHSLQYTFTVAHLLETRPKPIYEFRANAPPLYKLYRQYLFYA
jgi:hypothetical protein